MESWTICLSLFESVVVGINFKHFAPTYKFSTCPLPEASSDQNLHNPMLSESLVTLNPRTLDPRKPGLSPRPQQKSAIAV